MGSSWAVLGPFCTEQVEPSPCPRQHREATSSGSGILGERGIFQELPFAPATAPGSAAVPSQFSTLLAQGVSPATGAPRAGQPSPHAGNEGGEVLRDTSSPAPGFPSTSQSCKPSPIASRGPETPLPKSPVSLLRARRQKNAAL